MAQYMFSTVQSMCIFDSCVLTLSACQNQRCFEDRFLDVKGPGQTTIHKLHNKFHATGSVQSKKSNRQQKVLIEET